jgi:hypothetical protein
MRAFAPEMQRGMRTLRDTRNVLILQNDNHSTLQACADHVYLYVPQR